MPDRTITILGAYLWDLRAQCEAQLRSLTAVQRLLDDYRQADSPESRRAAEQQLQAHLQLVLEANATIRKTTLDAIEQATLLPQADDPPR